MQVNGCAGLMQVAKAEQYCCTAKQSMRIDNHICAHTHKPDEHFSAIAIVPFCHQVRKGEKALVLLTDALLSKLAEHHKRLGASEASEHSQQQQEQEQKDREQQQQKPRPQQQGICHDAPQSADNEDDLLLSQTTASAAEVLGGAAPTSPSAEAPAHMWAPFSSAVGVASVGGVGVWGATAPITPECHAFSGLPGFAAGLRDGRLSLGGEEVASCGNEGSGACMFGARPNPCSRYGPGVLFGADGPGSGGDGVGVSICGPGLGGRGDVEPLTPAAFSGGGRWGSGMTGNVPGSGTPGTLPTPLVGSFSMGTGLGLGTLLRAFGTDADGGGLEGHGVTSCFGGGPHGRCSDPSLLGPPPAHAPFGAPGMAVGSSAGLGGDVAPPVSTPSLFSSGSLGVGLPLGPSALDLVPRAIASVWGAPSPASAPRAEQSGLRGVDVADAQQQLPGGASGSGGVSSGSSHNLHRDEQQEQQQAEGHGSCRHDGDQLDPARPAQPSGLMSSSSSSGGLSLKGVGAHTAPDSSVPDTEGGTASPVSATGSDTQPGSGASTSASESTAAAGAPAAEGGDTPDAVVAAIAAEEAAAAGLGAGEDNVAVQEHDPYMPCFGGLESGASSGAGGGDEEEAMDGNEVEGGEGGADSSGGSGGSGDHDSDDRACPPKLTGWALVAAKTPPRPQKGAAGPGAPSAPRSGELTGWSGSLHMSCCLVGMAVESTAMLDPVSLASILCWTAH